MSDPALEASSIDFTLGNPLLSLVAAVLRAALYVLNLTRKLITFATLTVPRLVVTILHFSWTLQLNFPVLLFLGLLVPLALFLLVRFRYLNKYTNLKEVPLPKPDKKSLHPDVLSDTSSTPLHNYLDEFLAAIRIFGFLEKPVFHELSRHLQTRRLIAGDSLTLDSTDKSFYCVVDGHVQVFAPSPPTPTNPMSQFGSFRPNTAAASAEDDEPPLNGYDLLTEVSSGGTLSSLFTILSLFTEDIRLSWDSDESSPASDAGGEHDTPMGGGSAAGMRKRGSGGAGRRGGEEDEDVVEFDLGRRASGASLGGMGDDDGEGSVDTAIPDEGGPKPSFGGGIGVGESPRMGALRYGSSRNSSFGPSASASVASSAAGGGPRFTGGGGGDEERGTVARATVDTTLAVIPADAFRRLTRKFPKASAHIVQVILTRFSRVTFTTAHQYLGLTAEVLRAESSLNALVSHPLPAEFYEGGGMEALRQKFRPETKTTRGGGQDFDNDGESEAGAESDADYFSLRKTRGSASGGSAGGGVGGARRQGSASSTGTTPGQRTPGPGRAKGFAMEPISKSKVSSPISFYTPIPPSSSHHSLSNSPTTTISKPNTALSSAPKPKVPKVLSSDPSTPSSDANPSVPSIAPSPSPIYQRTSHPLFRRSSTRRQVQAGDLLSMTYEDETSYRPNSFGPTTPKPIRWNPDGASQQANGGLRARAISTSRRAEEGSPPISKNQAHRSNSTTGSMSDFNLRDAVMNSLAKSIGLIQPPRPPAASSSFQNSPFPLPSGSVSMASSPPLSAQRSSMFNSSFGPLSMLQRSMRGGMGGGDDETSSMATGISSGWGAANGDGQEELENEVEILFFPKGELIVREGEKNAGLFFVIDGFLEVSIPPPNRPKPAPSTSSSTANKPSKSTPSSAANMKKAAKPTPTAVPPKRAASSKNSNFDPPPPVTPGSTHLYTVKPGGIAGYLSALSDSASYVDLRAKTDIYVGFLPSEALDRLLERRPIVLLTLAKRLISLLSPLVLHIDASLDWMQLNAGQVLYRQGDPSDSIYIVINGRLRALQETEGGGAVETVAEHGQGESVGELDVITTSPRSNTVHAIRDTELARMPITLFNAISIRHPATTIKFLRLIASRVTKEVDDRKQRRPASSGASSGGIEATPSNLNLKTVAILPSSRNVPVAAFATKLRGALEDLGSPTAYLDQATVMRHLGRHTFSTMGKLKVAGWLAEQEQKYKMVLYVADTSVSSQWTVTCIRQADYIMVVGMGDDPSIGEYEKLLLASKTTARKELVLLHPDRTVPSGSTRPWLKERPWISHHLHVELPGLVLPPQSTPVMHDPAAVVAFKHLREKVQTQMKKFKVLRPIGRTRAPPHLDDFARLARRLCGVSIGVVLGGGGGKGISHLGFLQAMEDEGLPIDMIGGCSIGAFIGGLYAKDANLLATTGRTKQFSGRMANVWRLLSDVTFPTVSYTTGHEFNRGIFKAFNDVHLEDLWLPFFCNSTSLNYNRMEVHTTGYAWRAVRASMTLAGLLPPLSENGNMLVDGGYVDNLPCLTMTAMGASRIFAVDVGGIDDSSLRNYGDSVSGFWFLLNKFNPWYRPNSGPLTLTEVTGRLTYISSIKTLDEAKVMPGVLYQAMPIQSYDTLGSFGKFDEILKIGLDAATKQIAAWKAEGKLPTGVLEGHAVTGRRAKNSIRLRRNSI